MAINRFTTLIFILVIVLFASCCEENLPTTTEDNLSYFRHNRFGIVNLENDNQFTKERWLLGKKLFYDKRLSIDSSISCASCHNPGLAFADTFTISPGVFGRLGTRNAPSLANVGFQTFFNKDGNIPTLELQMLVPIQEHAEFGFNMVKLVERLSNDVELKKMSISAYGKELDPFVLTRSIGLFERSLISDNSNWDRFKTDGSYKLTAEETRGHTLFNTHCVGCHKIDDKQPLMMENNGIYENYKDPGLMRISKLAQDEGKFKVPSLQNIAITPPYMHDGSLRTLDEVIAHYNSGGKNHPNKSSLIRKLNLSTSQMEDLKSFLKTMTDEKFLNDVRYR